MKVVCLAGGVGGAKLVQGLDALELDLTVIVNTGDDFWHWGLFICPDVDTITYTLSGLADTRRGWGLEGESWGALSAMRRLGAEDWFGLGDHDLATHLRRTAWLREGVPLSEVTRRITQALGVRSRILPMSDAPCPTIVNGENFQTWLVRQRAPAVRSLETTAGPPAPGVQAALDEAELIVLAPSNPYVSIDPILGCIGALPQVPVRMVSPLIGGEAVKGPLAEMVPVLAGRPPSTQALLDHYGFAFDRVLEGPATLMPTLEDRVRVARALL